MKAGRDDLLSTLPKKCNMQRMTRMASILWQQNVDKLTVPVPTPKRLRTASLSDSLDQIDEEYEASIGRVAVAVDRSPFGSIILDSFQRYSRSHGEESARSSSRDIDTATRPNVGADTQNPAHASTGMDDESPSRSQRKRGPGSSPASASAAYQPCGPSGIASACGKTMADDNKHVCVKTMVYDLGNTCEATMAHDNHDVCEGTLAYDKKSGDGNEIHGPFVRPCRKSHWSCWPRGVVDYTGYMSGVRKHVKCAEGSVLKRCVLFVENTRGNRPTVFKIGITASPWDRFAFYAKDDIFSHLFVLHRCEHRETAAFLEAALIMHFQSTCIGNRNRDCKDKGGEGPLAKKVSCWNVYVAAVVADNGPLVPGRHSVAFLL